MKKIVLFSLIILFCFGPVTISYSQTEVFMQITRTGGEKIEMAIPDFEPSSDIPVKEAIPTETITDILKNDLRIYGLFNLIENPQFLKEANDIDRKEGKIVFKEWSLLGANALVKGSYTLENNNLSIEARLFDVSRGRQITGKRYTGLKDTVRTMIHKFSDEIIYRFTGEKGIAQTRILFESKVSGNKEIFIIDFDGHNIQKLTANRSLSLSPDWSPDGTKILYTTYRDNNPDLYLIDLKKGTNKPVSLRPGLNISPAWSPDGDKIALTLSKDGNPEIYTMDRNGKNLQRLTNSRAVEASPAWSPNGRQIAFTSDRSGGPQIYVMDSEGINLRRLTYERGYNDQAVWSPKGDKIAFVSKKEGRFNIYTMNVDGSDIRQLTSHSGNNENPSWSPDGRFLTFSSTRKGSPQIYFMKADGTGQKELTSLRGGGYNPSWSPKSSQ